MELVVASGKGGTGKTFVASNLCVYLRERSDEGVVAVDADVEAPDLLMALGGAARELIREEFYGSYMPVIDRSICFNCGRCAEACEFDAIRMAPEGPTIDYSKCEGLGTCAVVCSVKAIALIEDKTGDIYASETPFGVTVVTGDLELGKGNSGRLVYELKERAYRIASEKGVEFRVVDAAPGIGCPVVSSIAGADLLITVVEPTPQSLKGSLRLLEVAKTLGVRTVAVINKYDLNQSFTVEAGEKLGVEVLGYIPYDDAVVKSYTSATPLLEYSPGSRASEALVRCFDRLIGGWLK